MQGMNRVILVGNVGKDPDLRKLEGDVSTVNFPLATTDYYKNKSGETQEKTEWHNIVAWKGTADALHKIVKKGDRLAIEGELRTRKWESKSGETRYTTEVSIQTFIKL